MNEISSYVLTHHSARVQDCHVTDSCVVWMALFQLHGLTASNGRI